MAKIPKNLGTCTSVILFVLQLNMLVVTGKLVLLITLSRHGSRAPNDVIKKICPVETPSLSSYEVPLTELTRNGMLQLQKAGEHIRDIYVNKLKFLGPALSSNRPNGKAFDAYFRSDSANRCSQSATALGRGLYPFLDYPNGTKILEYQPLPIYMQLEENEHVFAATKNVCKRTLKKDLSDYASSRALELFNENSKLLLEIGKICHITAEKIPYMEGGEDEVLGLKDIADAFEFNREEGLQPVGGLTDELREGIVALAFQMLMERYYSTERMITYWCGDFPNLVLENIDDTISGSQEYLYYSYHGHRELLHGFALMLGWNFDFQGLPKAFNSTSLHPGTTMFFELHSDDLLKSFYINTFEWSPFTARTQIKLASCAMNCPLEDFRNIITSHIKRTGTWQQICHHSKDIEFSQSKGFYLFSSATIIGVLIIACVAIIWKSNIRKNYFKRKEYVSLT